MNVLFSNAPWWEKREWTRFKGVLPLWLYRQGVRAGSRWPFTYPGCSRPDRPIFRDYLPYPFFMGFAASYAQANTPANVCMRDSIALKESYRSYYQYLEQEAFDLLFFESSTPSWEHDVQIIRAIGQRVLRTKIVITGPIGIRGQELIDELGVHAVIKGEYDKGAVRVIQGESGVIDFDFLTQEEMNQAPYPYLDKAIAHRYYDAPHLGQRYPHLQIWSSRGCPFKCIFCVWPATMTGNDPDGHGKRLVRYYEPEYVKGWIEEYTQAFGFKAVYFDDDTFNLGDRHTQEICQVMQNIDLPWSAMCRSDTITLEMWRTMKESGCQGVKLGFESGSQYVVDKIVNKHLDLDYSEKVLSLLEQINMKVHATFTVGLPGETEAQMKETLRFVKEHHFSSYQISGCAEIDGTPLAELRKKKGLDRFEAARIDDTYVRANDGNKKWQQLVADLREK